MRVGIYMGRSQQRLDVYYNSDIHNIVHNRNTYKKPTNAVRLPGGGLKYEQPSSEGEYEPSLDDTSAESGENYLSLHSGVLYILVKGPGIVDIQSKPVLILGFNMPTMTEEEFFGDNIIANIAAFLGIPPHKIKVVEVVSEASRKKRLAGENHRLKRSTGITLRVEIGDVPTDDTDTLLGYEQLVVLSNLLKASIQNRQFGNIVGTDTQGEYLYEPVPPDSEEYTQEREAYLQVIAVLFFCFFSFALNK